MIEPQGSVRDWVQSGPNVRLGVDIARIADVARSVRRFGASYEQRVYTQHELDYASQNDAVRNERLAARFAAKEAVIKALGLADEPVDWRDIEVVRQPGGECLVALHGGAQQWAQRIGVERLLLSLSHEGAYAAAFVVALFAQPQFVGTEVPHST